MNLPIFVFVRGKNACHLMNMARTEVGRWNKVAIALHAFACDIEKLYLIPNTRTRISFVERRTRIPWIRNIDAMPCNVHNKLFVWEANKKLLDTRSIQRRAMRKGERLHRWMQGGPD
jgi:hypothetical protein